MKHLIIVLLIALSATVYGQGHVYTAPQTFTNTLTLTGGLVNTGAITNTGTTVNSGAVTNSSTVTNSGKVTFSGSIVFSKETASTHNYTLLGSPVCAITTTRLDTINLVTANYSAGQTFRFYTTTTANDSTKFISTTGNINGAASPYWLTGSTYKGVTLYTDGTDYWILK